FQRKNRFLAGSAPEKSLIFSGDWRGWQWRGSVLPRPPACQNFFDKLKNPSSQSGGIFLCRVVEALLKGELSQKGD
ncbi:MAG: hypothetical protein SOT76_11700, partial [Eubacteriales bacterium]|nr:hypothetical protein [bacterium]MDY2793387.1 hypothetical protein [Eubacteriales bacterium]